ncbi:hypothetical protein RUM44_007873 [Polyplax serrata]|uniref:Uncharacterized protein n=1 Tax=Polyplax serrata TaxID=468196 RepID=A0ABR1B7C7_POLSC
MNKTLFLLLVTLIQSQSNGVLLSGPNHSNKYEDNFEEFKLAGWENSDSPYTSDISKVFKSYKKRSISNDVLTRRSILDKTFMRFGRNVDKSCVHKVCEPLKADIQQPDKSHFRRTTRGMKDNFIRFGRGPQDNFIRFGRTSKVEGHALAEDFFRTAKSPRDNFIRFGRGDVSSPEEFLRSAKSPRDSFIRFGRDETSMNGNVLSDEFLRDAKSPKDSFIRFGRGDEPEMIGSALSNEFYRSAKSPRDNFIRFGRGEPSSNLLADEFHRAVKSPRDNFIRFGRADMGSDVQDEFSRSAKSPRDSFIRFGKMDKNFIRFGRGKNIGSNKYLLGNPDFFGLIPEKSDESSDEFQENTSTGATERNGKNSTRLKSDGGDGPDDKVIEFDQDNKDVDMDLVIRLKRNAVDTTGKNHTGKGTQTIRNQAGQGVQTFDQVPGHRSFDGNADKRSGSSYFRLIPSYFPDKLSRIQYGRVWDDFDTSRNYNRLSTPFFPVLTKF